MKKTKIISALLSLVILSACGKVIDPNKPVAEGEIFVEKIENLPEDFIRGVDISTVISEEKSGVIYKDKDGKPQDIFKTLYESGVNYIRVRLWNDPFDENGNGYGGGNCDLDTAIEIGKRATKNNMRLLVDFHYSDFWADPKKQMTPKAWENMSIDEKSDALYDFTYSCLSEMKKNKIDVGMVQIGNETNTALSGETNWNNISKLMTAGSKAVRDISPDIKIAVHFANPEVSDNYRRYAGILKNYEIDYDVFASSYYPFWHGTLENLTGILSEIAETYSKEVMVSEFSYAYTLDDSDDFGNSIGEGGTYEITEPFTVSGQSRALRNLMKAVADIGDAGIGVMYWEPAWIRVPAESFDERSEIWEKNGSGWASSFSAQYDPDDAGIYYGGSAWDNQAMFDKDGVPLPSLDTFKLIYNGSVTEKRVDSVANEEVTVRMTNEILLPELVRCIYNNGEESMISVEWESADLEAMSAGNPETYIISGKADGYDVYCKVHIVDENYVDNFDFEGKDTSMWRIINNDNVTTEIDFQEKATDAHSGVMSLHFYSSDRIDFKVEQDIENIPTGNYKFTISLQGGDIENEEMYIYCITGGETYTATAKVNGWANWQNPVIENIPITDGKATVGFALKADPKGWGTIDDFMLNPAR